MMITAGSYYFDRLGRVHGPMRFENGYFTDGGWRWDAMGVAEGEMRHNLDLLTEFDPAATIAALQKRVAELEAEIGWVDELRSIPAENVAKFWLDGESLNYRTVFADSALTRLTSVIKRARIDGGIAARSKLLDDGLVDKKGEG